MQKERICTRKCTQPKATQQNNEKIIIDENKVKESLEAFLENPYWREYYEKAPSEKCRRYISLEFYWSNDTDASDYEAEANNLLSDLDLEDWNIYINIREIIPGEYTAKTRLMN